jgi:Ni,Fe-hydrogenase III small subunit
MLKTLSKIASIGIVTERRPAPDEELRVSQELDAVLQRVLGRALCIRHVDAGSCNGCELEIHALNNPIYNIEGANIRFVASPRHADMLLVTGPVAANMAVALRRTYEATPGPKLVVAVGDCGCMGGIFGESYASYGRISNVIPVDVAVPGCPPSPARILQAILTAITVQEAGRRPRPVAAALPQEPEGASLAGEGVGVGTEAFTAPQR